MNNLRLQSSGSNIAKDLWQVVSAYRLRILFALISLMAAKIVIVSVPLVLKRIIDELSRPENVHILPTYLLIGYAVLRFSSTLFNEFRDLLFSRVTQHTVANFALKTFKHLHSLGASFYTERRLGGLLPDIDRGTNGISFLLGIGLFTIVPTFIEIGLVLAVMLAHYSNWYTGIIGLTFLAYFAFTVVFTNHRAIFQRKVNRLDSYAKSRLADSIMNADAVKYFTNETLEAKHFEKIMFGWSDAAVSNQKALFALHVGQSAMIAVGVGAVMLLAGKDVVDGHLTVGDLVLINAYVIQVCLPLNALGFVYREMKDALINTERLFQLLREKPDIEEPPDLPPIRIYSAEVIFDHVSFHYNPGRPILSDICFRIPPGKSVAVVGGSGSGKSTLARLLLRLYDVSNGRILVDGQDIRKVSSLSLRQAIGIVPQDTILFNESIAYNIGYGRPEAGLEEIIQAAKSAHIHQFIISLPDKYETAVGERGVKLSGGEKQRIALARAILKNPPILIFDEATSALDLQSEREIQTELNRLSQGRTTLVIAHRLSTITNADEILVLEHGHIIERGTHKKLLRQSGVYTQLWQLQMSAEKLEETSTPVTESA